jgi:hypothetical protein
MKQKMVEWPFALDRRRNDRTEAVQTQLAGTRAHPKALARLY